jgi:transcriptional regulator with XRE-family HTH domain
MTYEKFRAELIAAGLTLREFAELLKLNPNSVTNYNALGKVPDHIAVIASLIHELVKQGGDFRPAIKRANVRRKAPRGRSIA